jgi:hypothetical protein
MGASVEIREEDDGYTAIDSETGERAHGATRAVALTALAIRLFEAADGDQTDVCSEAALRRLSEKLQDRFEEAGVTEDDVGDAIAWARSE